MSVYAPLLGAVWSTLESYGVDPGLAIDKMHYRPGDESVINRRVTHRDFDAALARVAALVDDPAVGIRIAQFMHPSHVGALGHAWMASSSLRHALQLAARFHHMINEQVEFQVEELSDRVRVTYRMLQNLTAPDLLEDGQLAVLLMMCRLNYGSSLRPVEVTLKHAEPADPRPWLECFGNVVHFEQPATSLAINARDADKPLTGSNKELFQLHEELIRRYLFRLDRNNILNRTRLRIMEQLPSGRVTENDLARVLNISKRTLNRKLRENDETFRSLLMQVRRGLAERYIGNENYSVTEIAFLLGYNDTSAFSRAFKNWFGRSPTQVREDIKAA
jgi:AraC-like DNA-binding protein